MCNWTGEKSGWVFCNPIAPLVTNANVFPIEIGYFRWNSRQGRISWKSLDDDQNKPYCTIGPPPQFVSEPHDPASSAISRRRCGSTTTKIRWWPPSLLLLRPFRLPTAWPTTTKRGIGSWKAAWQTRGASDSNRRVANRDSGVETLTSGEDAITPHSSNNNNTQILYHLAKVGWCAVVICISCGLSLSLSRLLLLIGSRKRHHLPQIPSALQQTSFARIIDRYETVSVSSWKRVRNEIRLQFVRMWRRMLKLKMGQVPRSSSSSSYGGSGSGGAGVRSWRMYSGHSDNDLPPQRQTLVVGSLLEQREQQQPCQPVAVWCRPGRRKR